MSADRSHNPSAPPFLCLRPGASWTPHYEHNLKQLSRLPPSTSPPAYPVHLPPSWLPEGYTCLCQKCQWSRDTIPATQMWLALYKCTMVVSNHICTPHVPANGLQEDCTTMLLGSRVRPTSPELPGSSSLPFLTKGVAFALLQSSATSPKHHEFSQIVEMISRISSSLLSTSRCHGLKSALLAYVIFLASSAIILMLLYV